ncbi:MAG: YkgJ family cysteine cluster protein [Rhodocyclaceae bacterium]|nr:YkgJ family cysteine cluster protein [Rhodocyclaceae bacterium]
MTNPCLSCGACCANSRVVFDASEADDQPGGFVPSCLCAEYTDTLRIMEGTDYARPQCVALSGRVGEKVSCDIYASRPSPCRDFESHGLYGISNVACNDARRRHGLPPLPNPKP